MAEHVRLTQPDKIEFIRALLVRQKWPLLVAFAAQLTSHPLLIVPATAVEHIGYDNGCYSGGSPEAQHYVGVMEFGKGLYPFTLGHIDSGYFAEKMRMTHVADARNIVVFLNALGHASGVRPYLSTIPMDGDHVDHNSEVLSV